MQKALSAQTLSGVRETGSKAKLNSVDVTCERLGIGRTMLYRAMHASPEYRKGLPPLRSVTIGGKRLVSDAAIEEFIAALEAQQTA